MCFHTIYSISYVYALSFSTNSSCQSDQKSVLGQNFDIGMLRQGSKLGVIIDAAVLLPDSDNNQQFGTQEVR